MDFGGRKEMFRALVGSHNYNLNTETSDKDYKVFVTPSFDDLYFNKQFSKSYIGETEDFDCHDVRKVSNLWWKANVNFLEVLFSKELQLSPYLSKSSSYLIRSIFKNRDKIVKMNLPYLYNACIGMHLTKKKQIDKETKGTQYLVDKYGFNCYTEDTKFLTNDGWKLYDDISNNDKLATVNPLGHSIEFQNFFDRIKKHHKGKVYEMDNVFSNCMVTGNHRMYVSQIKNRNKNGLSYKEENANWNYESMENLINNKTSYYHVLNSGKNINKDFNISDDMLKIIGLYVSEGTLSFRNNKVKSIRITQTLNGKKEFFNEINNINSYGFRKYEYGKETVWISHNKDLCNFLYQNCNHKSEKKRLPNFIYNLSKRQCDILLHSLYLGDGTDKKINDKKYGIVYYTINKKLAEDVQTLALLAEKNNLLWGGEDGYKSISNLNGRDLYMYQVYIKEGLSTPKTIIFKNHTENGVSSCSKGIESFDYDGKIVCFSVPNENLITQRKGKIAVQGNTKQAMHSIRILDFLRRFANSEFNDFEFAIKYDNEDDFRELLLDIKNGIYSKEQFLNISDNLFNEVEKDYKEIYYAETPNELTNKNLTNVVMEIVKNELF